VLDYALRPSYYGGTLPLLSVYFRLYPRCVREALDPNINIRHILERYDIKYKYYSALHWHGKAIRPSLIPRKVEEFKRAAFTIYYLDSRVL